jgi:DMSO/TMAO reductase YedYZ molybdopterin-dependent catalytic subunit
MAAPPEPTGLAPGQYYSKRWIYYSALGEPDLRAEDWRLKVGGLVDRPAVWSLDELARLPPTRYRRDFQCVTKWSIRDVEWEGVSLVELGNRVGVRPGARWVNFRCADGYVAPVPREDALSPDAIVAFRMNGAALPRPQGYPARPFIPHLYGWKSAKWLTEIEFVAEYADGYWEQYGYHERANIWEEERFKGHTGTHQRHRSTASTPA